MWRPFHSRLPGLLAGLVCMWLGSTAESAVITEYPLPSAAAQPRGIAAGPDGNLWFTEYGANRIGRISPGGVIAEFELPGDFRGLHDIAAGPDGNLWFTEHEANRIGRISPAGVIAEFDVPTPGSHPGGISAGPDGNLWFTQESGGNIGRIRPDGTIDEFPLPSPEFVTDISAGTGDELWFTAWGRIGRITIQGAIDFPYQFDSFGATEITVASDGSLWFTSKFGNSVTRVNEDGAVTNFFLSGEPLGPTGIVEAPDGSIWFTESFANDLGRIQPDGTLEELIVRTTANAARGIAVGPQGRLWFTEEAGNKIGVVDADFTTAVRSALLPTARSVQVGSTATAFAAIANTGSEMARGCNIGVRLPSVTIFPPDFFNYQTTDPNTNAVVGTINTPVDIPAGQTRTFVISDLPFSAYTGELVLDFTCENTTSARSISGLNRLEFAVSDTPVPDIVALSATPTSDGILNVPGEHGANAFVVATINLGVASSITASADSGDLDLALTLFLCQTDPPTGACLSPPATTVTTNIESGAAPTFSVFANASDRIVFDPANRRIHVRFTDGDGTTRGATSVAVRTQ